MFQPVQIQVLVLDNTVTLSHNLDTTVLGELNADIGKSQKPRSQKVANLLMEFRMMNLLHHFQQSCQFRHTIVWYQVIQGSVIQARCDYILGKDQYKELPSDHFALQARLLVCPTEAGHHWGAGGLQSQIGAVHGGI